jgi:hypothetical protein
MSNEKKEKNEKSASSKVDFPIGVWTIGFTLENTDDPLVLMGSLELAGPGNKGNMMKFADNPHFAHIKDTTFSVNVYSFTPEDGHIHFHILEAAEHYNPATPIPFRFMFEGVYASDDDAKEMELNGTGKVPLGFYPRPNPKAADGDNVTWTSKGITDPPHKHSK